MNMYVYVYTYTYTMCISGFAFRKSIVYFLRVFGFLLFIFPKPESQYIYSVVEQNIIVFLSVYRYILIGDGYDITQ